MLSIKLILGMELIKPAGANVFPIICKDQRDRRSASGLLISEYTVRVNHNRATSITQNQISNLYLHLVQSENNKIRFIKNREG